MIKFLTKIIRPLIIIIISAIIIFLILEYLNFKIKMPFNYVL